MGGVVALGECMVEISLEGGGQAAVGYAGDTFNTAVYLRRLGREVSYGTALGDGDPFSSAILGVMAFEGIDASLVTRIPGRLPGLYAIERDPSGERKFFYWRDQAPAREFFKLGDRAALERAVTEAELLYLSGITLAIVGEAGRAAAGELVAAAVKAGVPIAFDPNYRPLLWADEAQAKAAIEAVVSHCRYISVSGADLEKLYARSIDAVARDWSARGAEVVARNDDRTVTVHADGQHRTFTPPPLVQTLDATGAGDAFNAGYLDARIRGKDPAQGVSAGRRLARVVVQHLGAIIPKAAMPDLEP
jgi:2-dehydro-3-deoxygluconokinase